MAENVLKLKVDSQEYDNKIKRAAEGIQAFARKCQEAGQSLNTADSDAMEFVQALGKMDTVATGTKQQLREMSNALTTLTMTYRGLTDEEKASPFGQELAKGIQQLTERAGEAQDAMGDVQLSIRNAASDTRLFDQMAQGMSVATAGFQGLTGAGKLLGIEMGNDVEVIAKLQAAMAVTNSLTTIQNALQKQSALMQGLNAAKTALASAAQTAYSVATGEATVAQTAFNIAASANPYGLLLAGVGALVGAIAAFASTTGESTDEVKDAKDEIDTLTQSVNTAAEAYERLSNRMKNLGIGGQKEYHTLRQAKVDQYNQLNERYANIGNNMRFYENRGKTDSPIYQQLKEEHQRIKEEAGKIMKDIKTLDAANKERVDRMNQYKRLDFSDVTSQAEAESAVAFLKEQMRYIDNTTESYRQLKKAKEYAEDFILPSYSDPKANTTTPKWTGGSKTIKEEKDDFVEINGLIAQAEEHISNLQQRIKDAPDETTIAVLKKDLAAANDELKRLNGIGSEVSTAALPPLLQMYSVLKQLNEDLENAETPEDYQNLLADIKAINDERDAFTGKNKGKSNDKEDKKQEKSLAEGLGKLAGGLGGIQSGFQQLGIDLGSGFNDVVNGIQGVTSILTAIQSIVTAIQIISSVPFFARGGVVHAASGFMVPGNNFSGDLVPAYLNSGEMVLNRFQQQALAGTLENGGLREVNVRGHLEGETIVLAADRWGRRTGKGELAFWK